MTSTAAVPPPAAPPSEKRSQKQISRLTGAEGLRALACLNVFFFHAVIRVEPANQHGLFGDVQDFLQTGAVGVAVFFVLSGILLSFRFWMAYFTRSSWPSIGHFVRRRVSRILPAFYVVLVISFLIDASNASAGGQEAPFAVRRLISGLTLTSSFHYETYFPTESNIPLWAVPMEAVCYVLLPLAMWGLFKIAKRGRRIGIGYWLGVIALAAIVHEWVLRTFPMDGGGFSGALRLARDQMPDRNPAGYFGQFAIGVLAAALIVLWKLKRDGKRTWWFDGVAVTIAVGLTVFFWVIRGDWGVQGAVTLQDQPYYYPWLAILLAALAVSLGFSRWTWRAFEIAPLKFIAKYSYGIYLWHALVFDWYARNIDSRFFWRISDDPAHFWRATLVCLAITIILAMISWRVIERPFVLGRFSGLEQSKREGADAR